MKNQNIKYNMKKILKTITGIVITSAILSNMACSKGQLGDECFADDECSDSYSCVKCSVKNACYFSDMLTSQSAFERACTAYGSGSPTNSPYSGGGGGGTNGSGGSYNWTYTCPGGYGGGGTVPIPTGSCETQYKNYAKTYGCNDYLNFKKVCIDLYGCLGQSTTMCNSL